MTATIQTKAFYDDNLSSIDVKLLDVVKNETMHGAKRFDYRKLAEKIGVRSWDTVSTHVGRLIRIGLIEVDYSVSGIQLTERAKALMKTP